MEVLVVGCAVKEGIRVEHLTTESSEMLFIFANSDQDPVLLMREHDFSIVFVKVRLEDLGGSNAAIIIRSDVSSIQNLLVPIIALVEANKFDYSCLIKEEFDDYIIVPKDHECLIELLVRAVECRAPASIQ